MGKTFKALKRYYTKKGEVPAASIRNRSEVVPNGLPSFDGTAGTEDITEPNTINGAGTVRRRKEIDPDWRKNSSTSRTRPLDKAHPTGYFKIYNIKKPTAKKILLNLRHNVVREIIEFKYFLKIRDFLKFINGELLKSDGGMYYKIGFESGVMESILFDREGNFINFINACNQRELLRSKMSTGHSLLDCGAVRRFEGNFLDSFCRQIDFNTLKKLFKDVFKLSLTGDIVCRDGRINVSDNQVAYEIVFHSKVRFFLLMDNRGNYLDTTEYNETIARDKLIEELHESRSILPPFSLLKNRRLLPD